MLQAVLSQRFPSSRIEVVNAAMVAINSHVILPIAKDCATRQGDLWVVYMGNNEMIGPFGSVTVLGAQAPPLWRIRAVLGLKTARILQVADLAWQRLNRPDPARSDWGGMTMWWGQGVAQDDPKTARVYANFRRNLAEILQAAREAGVPVLLCTVATNTKDCAPFASLHRKGLSPGQLTDWEANFHRGKSLQAEGRPQEAAAAYAEAAKIDSEYAELTFRQAQCLLAANRVEEAKELFRRARDADALQFRADTRINEIIRELAAAESGRGVELLDAERLLAEASPQGLPGREFFYEHVHLTPEGNYQLTRDIAERAEKTLVTKLKSVGTPRPWLAMSDCFKYIGLVDWNRHETLIDLLKRVQQPPFLEQVNHSNQVQHLQEQEARYRPASKSTQVARAAQQVVELAKARPDEPDLIWNVAQLLGVAGDFAASERYWRATIQLRPNSDLPRYNLAKLLEIRSDGRTNEIEQLYQQTIELAPRNHDAHFSLGCFLLQQGRAKESIPHLRVALQIRPGLAETHHRLGLALKEVGQASKAEEQFRLARKLDPGLSTPP
jgi:tetratricopeptide (TPR) repeat protein